MESRSLREFMVSQHQYFIDVETDIVETLGDVPQQRINFIVQGLIDEGDINSPYVVIHEPGNAPKLEPTTYELYKEFIEETGLNFPDTTTIHLDVGDERINLDSLFNTSP